MKMNTFCRPPVASVRRLVHPFAMRATERLHEERGIGAGELADRVHAERRATIIWSYCWAISSQRTEHKQPPQRLWERGQLAAGGDPARLRTRVPDNARPRVSSGRASEVPDVGERPIPNGRRGRPRRGRTAGLGMSLISGSGSG